MELYRYCTHLSMDKGTFVEYKIKDVGNLVFIL